MHLLEGGPQVVSKLLGLKNLTFACSMQFAHHACSFQMVPEPSSTSYYLSDFGQVT